MMPCARDPAVRRASPRHSTWGGALVHHALGLSLALASSAAGAGADTITLEGSTIPLRDCTIQEIRRGHLTYLDAADRRQRIPLDHVAALGFEGLAPLDDAEAALAAHDYAGAIGTLLDAALAADTPTERIWVHARLSRTHDALHQFVQAAGHAAAVFLLEDDPYWARLAPLSDPDTPTFAAAAEAMQLLGEAQRRVRNVQLVRAINDLIARVRPVHDSLKPHYTGPQIRSGSTLSGFDRGLIRERGGMALVPRRPPDAAPEPDKAQEPVHESSSGGGAGSPRPAADPAPLPRDRTPDAIDALLHGGQPSAALAACEAVSADFDDRDVGRFLHQYGLALAGVGREPDAAVMFLRSATLHPGGGFAAASLIEAADIVRGVYHNRAAAIRLLQRAESTAARLDQPDIATRARVELESARRSEDGPAAAP
jgi:hypothetical protein